MIDAKALLNDLRKLVTKLEKDLRERCEENAEVDARVRIEYEKAKEAKRTAQAYKVWRDEWITQVAVAWVLGVVFVRFIEDNGLIAAPFIAGPGERLQFAKEQRTAFFQQNPTQSDREYLEHVFREVAKLPAMKELYDERHNPLWALGVSGDGAKLILEQFQKIDPGTGTLVHDFTDPEWNTRFLGDLYQDLSEAARKKYALLQTPEFVEEFILDRTLDPAVAEFGLETVRLIDPTCGSGHFLLGGFARLFRLWQEREPSTNPVVLAQRTLDAIHGVDLNPYAIAISRFRLLVASLKVVGIHKLADAANFHINLAVGDSLLHGSPGFGGSEQTSWSFAPFAHLYETEDQEMLERILQNGRYHVVVGNPPYITVRDKALSALYRKRFASCHKKYSLVVPFVEKFFSLGVSTSAPGHVAGHVGLIVSNSFAKREFGSKLIEVFLPSVDLQYIVDTSGAYIPGHGTPTMILLGRSTAPRAASVRSVAGVAGEPSVPDDPARGQVWSSICRRIDSPGATDAFVSVSDVARETLGRHPWTLGAGNTADVLECIASVSDNTVADVVTVAGVFGMTNADEVMLAPLSAFQRKGVPSALVRLVITGDQIRDWTFEESDWAIFPYAADRLVPIESAPKLLQWMWPAKSTLENRATFSGKTYAAEGRPWWEWHQVALERLHPPWSLVAASVATHNHFLLDRGEHVFKQSAVLLKLPADAAPHQYFVLLGLLNSSIACFWLKQMSYPKSSATGDISKIKGRPEANRYDFAGSTVARFPLPTDDECVRVAQLAQMIDDLALRLDASSPPSIIAAWDKTQADGQTLLNALRAAAIAADAILGRMVALQEELDWEVYRVFGLAEEGADMAIVDDESFVVKPDDRPFRFGSEPSAVDPAAVPDTYRRRWSRINQSGELRELEQPKFKRLWQGRQGVFGRRSNETWEERALAALRAYARRTIEAEASVSVAVRTVSDVAHALVSQANFMAAGEVLVGRVDFEPTTVVDQIVRTSSVPCLASDRLTESGLRKRAAWEQSWETERAHDQPHSIPVPPPYSAEDFKMASYWSLRGKLDVPKESFLGLHGCERESDPSLPILWAGFDYLQQAKAIAAYYQDLKDNEAAAPTKLGKLLACILELLPWLKQWHNEIDPEYGTRMGDFFESFMQAEMAGLGLTMDDLRRIRGL